MDWIDLLQWPAMVVTVTAANVSFDLSSVASDLLTITNGSGQFLAAAETHGDALAFLRGEDRLCGVTRLDGHLLSADWRSGKHGCNEQANEAHD